MKNDKKGQQYRVNEQIRVREVRIVGDGESMVVPTRQALDMAHQQGVDLVEISPNANPPVCRLIDYSKFLYQQKKRAKEMKAKQVKQEVKEIRFGPQTDDHDYNFKLKHAKEFLMGVSPKIVFSPEPTTEFSLSLGLNPRANNAEEILDLPEKIARKRGIQIVVCIDEFQQIGEMPDSLTIQKTIRSVWQHHQHTSYCLFGSKQHLMSKLFYSRKLPFYQFGDMFFLRKIPTDKWIPFIISRFEVAGRKISVPLAEKICTTVENYSAYVQQLAWNVLIATETEATEQTFIEGLEATLAQVAPLFVEQTANLSSYQLNLIRAICSGYHTDFGKQEVTSRFALGTRSNLPKLKKALIDREFIDETESGLFLSDPLFVIWFNKNMM